LQFAEEETTESNTNPIIKAELIRWLTEIIAPNQSFEIEYEWAGIMGMDKNRQPIVEKYGEHCYLAVRMGGMGVALSSLVAEKLAILVD
jgi:glycine/D-amino acid oxidase-like deaminating enzyme